VAIASALINNPSIILGDEPTGNLDTKTRDQIMDYLEKLNKEGMTIVVVTHDLEIAKRAKSIIRLQDGQIIKHYLIEKKGGSYEFFQREKIENSVIRAGGSAELAEKIGTEVEGLIEEESETSTEEIRQRIIKELEKAGKRDVVKKFANFKKMRPTKKIE
jgi:ABC-type multidrug transport system ATPase subunit